MKRLSLRLPFLLVVVGCGDGMPPSASMRDANLLINNMISERWKQEDIRPSDQSDDYEFIRRLSLDVRGVIPTLDEVRAFAGNTDSHKREEIIDRWLRSKDFAEYWAYLWLDELLGKNFDLIKVKTLGPPFTGLWWVRDCFEQNMPYDRFVTKILAPQRDSSASILAYILWSTEQSKEIGVRSAKVFLGTQIQCAECHDHPFDNWTQQDYKSMVAFFEPTRLMDAAEEDRPLTGISDSTLDREQRLEEEQDEPKPSPVPKYKATGEGPTQSEPFREAFARLLVNDPQFARATVNRHWGLLMGRGLVHPLDGFTADNPPSHPALLDALAKDFVASDFDVRRLIKSILMSDAYQLSSKRAEKTPRHDRLFAHALTLPMRWRQLFNSLLRVTGMEVALRMKHKNAPRKIDLCEGLMHQLDASLHSDEVDDPNGIEPTTAQALFFLNAMQVDVGSRVGEDEEEAARWRLRPRDSEHQLLSRILKNESNSDRVIEELYLSTLSRLPTQREQTLLQNYLHKDGSVRRGSDNSANVTDTLTAGLQSTARSSVEEVARSAERPQFEVRAYEDIFWALINSTEFVTRH